MLKKAVAAIITTVTVTTTVTGNTTIIKVDNGKLEKEISVTKDDDQCIVEGIEYNDLVKIIEEYYE